jgi:hypothetical protein
MEQAMSMIMTGGAAGPETIRYSPATEGNASLPTTSEAP